MKRKKKNNNYWYLVGEKKISGKGVKALGQAYRQ